MRIVRSVLPMGLAAVAATAFVLPSAAGATTSRVGVTPVVTGLNAPRGIVLDTHGNLYVSQSGRAGSGPAGLTRTGSVSKFRHGTRRLLWSTRFESLYVTEDPTAPPDVLGPEGLSTLGRGCGFGGCPLTMITSESHDGIAAATHGAVRTHQAGHLFTLDRRTGRAHDRADVGDQNYAWTAAHKALFPSDFPDSNPYNVLVVRSRSGHVRTFVIDAGANTVSEVRRNGTLRVIAFIPNETAAPFRDATPTCAAMGPDGMLYVGTLDLVANFASNGGQSHVWRVNPNANFPTKPTVWASGLTTITSCTFDRHGNFWATEMFASNGPSAPPGDIVRVDGRHPSRQTHVGGGRLPLPGGIAFGPHGGLYVSINSANPTPGSGAVVRVQ